MKLGAKVKSSSRNLCSLTKFLVFALFVCSSNIAEAKKHKSKEHKTQPMPDDHDAIQEWVQVRGTGAGICAQLLPALEWLYCASQDPTLHLFLDVHGYNSETGNLFLCFFKPINDLRVTTTLPRGKLILMRDYPGFNFLSSRWWVDPRFLVTHGMVIKPSPTSHSHVYQSVAFYTDPDFLLYRTRLHQVINSYCHLTDQLSAKVNEALQILNEHTDSPIPNYKIGFHIRYIGHYAGCDKSEEEFLHDIEFDIDQIMKNRDPRITIIYLSTLLQPVVDRISSKYKVVVRNICRVNSANEDWGSNSSMRSLHHRRHQMNGWGSNSSTYSFDGVCDAMIDMYCLADCDEIWGGSSNMLLFTGCLNPNVKIHILPSLAQYNGR